MGRLAKAWRWGVVVPATIAAFAGGVADVVTGTVQFWYLLAPSYLVIAVATWRAMTARTVWRTLMRAPPDDEPAAPEPATMIVAEPPHATVGSVLLALVQAPMRLVATLVVTFMYLVGIWAAIPIATWARPFWYVYVPVLALLAWFVWLVIREPDEPDNQDKPIVS